MGRLLQTTNLLVGLVLLVSIVNSDSVTEEVPSTATLLPNNTEEDSDGKIVNDFLSNLNNNESSVVTQNEKILQELVKDQVSQSDNSIFEKFIEDKYDENFETWEAPDKIQKNYLYYLSGHDFDNRPIWIAELGHWNLRKIVEEGGEDLKAFDKYVQQSAYRIVKSIKARSTPEEPVQDAVLFVDFKDMNLVQLAHVPTMSYLLKLAQRYTPLIVNLIDQGYIVNANFIAERMLNLLKPIMGRVIEKCEIYGSNSAMWIPRLLRKLPKSQIPQWYGGNKDFKPLQVYG